MRSLMRKAGLMFVGGLAVALLAADPSVASAKPRPGAKPAGFRLFARTLGAITGNRIFCGLNAAKGHVCVDSLGSSTIGGGFWPKGTIDQYVFQCFVVLRHRAVTITFSVLNNIHLSG